MSLLHALPHGPLDILAALACLAMGARMRPLFAFPGAVLLTVALGWLRLRSLPPGDLGGFGSLLVTLYLGTFQLAIHIALVQIGFALSVWFAESRSAPEPMPRAPATGTGRDRGTPASPRSNGADDGFSSWDDPRPPA